MEYDDFRDAAYRLLRDLAAEDVSVRAIQKKNDAVVLLSRYKERAKVILIGHEDAKKNAQHQGY